MPRPFADFLTLCKPKVIILMIATLWVGMFLGSKTSLSLPLFVLTTLGVALSAASAAVINQLADRHIDAKMVRTAARPVSSGRITPKTALWFAIILGVLGLSILIIFINLLTAFLTFLTVLGYAFFYTLYLKHATPQNIVIGGLFGAMPPLLGWAAVTNQIEANALLLVLIIYAWTPPHFWALAIHRYEDYKNAGIPMLPVTHGIPYTKLFILLYSLLLFAVSLLPFVTNLSGMVYLITALVLGLAFTKQTFVLYARPSNGNALKTFYFSIVYLLLLFIALLFDHSLKNAI